jgi:hypothetical protein
MKEFCLTLWHEQLTIKVKYTKKSFDVFNRECFLTKFSLMSKTFYCCLISETVICYYINFSLLESRLGQEFSVVSSDTSWKRKIDFVNCNLYTILFQETFESSPILILLCELLETILFWKIIMFDSIFFMWSFYFQQKIVFNISKFLLYSKYYSHFLSYNRISWIW